MSNYDDPKVITYNYSALNVGGGTITRKIRVPKGALQARVLDIHTFATVTFTNVTTTARVQVGVAGALGKFADAQIDDLAANAAQSFADTNGGGAIWTSQVDNVAELTVTFVAPTGGTPAGTADFTIAIAWDHIN